MKTYDVLDVAHYIIAYSNEKNYGVSNLKLQKLLYFVQAHFLLNHPKRKPCFNEPIEAWDIGPVVVVVYLRYKQYGSCDIPTPSYYLEFKNDDIWSVEKRYYDDSVISPIDKKHINQIIDRVKDYAAVDLTEITQSQTPWRAALETESRIITNQAILDYFNSL